MNLEQYQQDRIKRTLRSRTPNRLGISNRREAAVLLPLFMNNGEPFLLFTKRSTQMRYHRGHLAFPGGSIENIDGSPARAALREANEEIGLSEEDVTLLGPLDDSQTFVPPFVVHPFVGMIPYPYPFMPNKDEVDKIIEIPLRFFLVDAQIQRCLTSGGEAVHGSDFYPEFRFHGETIWGTTASIVSNFFLILENRI